MSPSQAARRPWRARISILALGITACTSPAARSPATRAAPSSPDHAAERGFALPVALIDQRWFLQTTTASGAPIRIFLDSAGGLYITRAAATRLGLAIRQVSDDNERPHDAVSFPAFADPRIPAPPYPEFSILEGFGSEDAMFGAPWFDEHTVAFDYPRQQLIVLPSGALPEVPAEHRLPVGFPRDASGNVTSPYGRIQMTVDGTTFDMLLDTGATITLSDAALHALGGTTRERGTSFITRSVFARWRAAHPEWRVIDGADAEVKPDPEPMIEVPAVTIAGHRVGPVWFTRRADHNFHEWMAQWMDRPTEGALGGSAFHFMRITVDWKAGVATFER